MRRMLLAVTLAILIGPYAQLVGAQQMQNQLVGVWRGALPNGNTVEISMASDGRAMEQTAQPGGAVTAYGQYSAEGNILTMVFTV